MTGNARAFALAVVLLVSTMPLAATIQRTFVASAGMDTNTCARDQPCRNFSAAITQTTAGGEVVVLDSAGYGAIALINKSVAIIAPQGVHAAMSVFSGDGITINVPGGSVLIRNLFLTGLGGFTGINVQDVATLEIDRTTITGFVASGLYQAPPSGGELILTDSVMRKNGGSGAEVAGGGTQFASIIRSRFEDNGVSGLVSWGECRVNVEDSLAAGNGGTGFKAVLYANTQQASVLLERSTAVHNNIGIESTLAGFTGSAVVRVSNSTIYANATGVSPATGAILSRQNNSLVRNVSDGAFTGTYPTQ